MNKKLFRNGPYADFFSHGVQTGNILTLAGQLGKRLHGMQEVVGSSPTSSTNTS